MATDTELLDAMRTSLREHREAIESKLDEARRESSASTRRIYDRIDEHAAETRNAIAKVSMDLTVVATRFDAHDVQDERRFTDIDEQLDAIEAKVSNGDRDRARLWRRIAAGTGLTGAGGALVGGIVALWEWLKNGGAH